MIYLQGNQDEEYTRVCPYISLIIPPLHTNTEKIYCSNTFAEIIILIHNFTKYIFFNFDKYILKFGPIKFGQMVAEKIYCSNTFADIIISIIPLMMLNRNKVAALLVDAPKA